MASNISVLCFSIDEREVNVRVDGKERWFTMVESDDDGGLVRIDGVMYRICGCSIYPV